MLERDIEADLVPVCDTNGIGLLPYYPIARGLLTGKYRRDAEAPAGSRLAGDATLADADFNRIEKLETYANDHGRELLTLAMSWLAAQPSIASIIAGASRPEQMMVNAAAVSWKLTPDNLTEIDAIVSD